MNIGIFTDTYYPQINGVATSTRMLQKELSKRGHNVFIFTTSDPKAEKSPRVFRVPSMPFFFLPTHRVGLAYSPKLILQIKKFQFDIIHTQTEFPMGIFGKIVADFYKIPTVHTYHTMYEDYVHYIANGHLITPKMAQKYSRIFCNGSKAVIAPVEKARESLLEYGVYKPIHIIPTGLDFEPFSRNKYTIDDINREKEAIGLNPSDPVVVSVGRIAQEKSLDVVVNQMPALIKKLPDAKLVIVGNGPKKDELMRLALQLGIDQSVIFTGPKPWDEIGKFYQMGDVFVSASTSETQGLTYIESMAAKVPVVAKKDKSVEGVIIDGKTGFYFEQDHELSNVLYNTLTASDKNEKIIENAFSHIQHLSSANFAKNVEALYTEVLEKDKYDGTTLKQIQ